MDSIKNRWNKESLKIIFSNPDKQNPHKKYGTVFKFSLYFAKIFLNKNIQILE